MRILTAEIAIMNKEAVVLAADSAGSIGFKVYNTMNKLFTLSKYNPVGIMFYGSSVLMGIPWETIIKTYRKQLGATTFENLEDYADDFLKFLNSKDSFFPEKHQNNHFKIYTYSCFKELAEKIRSTNNELRLLCIDDEDLADLDPTDYLYHSMKNVIEEEEKNLKEYVNEICEHISGESTLKLIKTYKKIILELKNELFKDFPEMDDQLYSKLENVAAYSYYKENVTGLVISGFGEEDLFPSLVSYIVIGIVENKLIFKKIKNQCSKITFENPIEIFPFAQSDMMDTFLYGINPTFKSLLNKVFMRLFEEYPQKTFDHIIKVVDNEGKDESLTKKVKDKYEDLKKDEKPELDKLMKKLLEQIASSNILPIKEAVNVLPKDEMASMAESLLKLTSLKRKVSLRDTESVGGFIDVAVISKGDGFVWIKRKHYFNPDLNQHFFNNYFRSDDEADLI